MSEHTRLDVAKRFGTFCFSFAATIFFGILWVNNLISAWHVHVALFAGEVVSPQQAGVLPAFSWSVVDVSTVTTLIPFLGFLLISIAVLCRKAGENWPFFDGYDRFNIALGLLGTLWGIILIGFYPSDQVTIPALMNCLHTAMFSTLAAIVWVMILEPLILVPVLRSLVLDETEPQECDLEGEIDRTIAALKAVNRELERSGSDAYDLRMEFSALSEELSAGRRLSLQWRNEIAVSLRSMVEITASLQEQQKLLTGENSTLRGENEALRKQNNALAEEKTQVLLEKESVVKEVEKLRAQLDSVRQLLR